MDSDGSGEVLHCDGTNLSLCCSLGEELLVQAVTVPGRHMWTWSYRKYSGANGKIEKTQRPHNITTSFFNSWDISGGHLYSKKQNLETEFVHP